ncbi:MAG: DNA-protecting protein DprA [Candidatus Zixiibacteriota bacterium]|nr:MAG: DNA-protecting protein DprA [candidate division Zixibacteria bacterium]
MIDPSRYTLTTQILTLCHMGGIGPRMFESLVRAFGSAGSILSASDSELDTISAGAADMVRTAFDGLEHAEELLAGLKQRDISIINRFEEDYPATLLELNDPPSLIFVRGLAPVNQVKSVALLGADSASNQGIELTTRLAREFAGQDLQIISSLSGGIANAAHLASKAAGGRSFAVIDSGFDHLERDADIPLAIDVAQSGGVVSEYLPDRQASDNSWQDCHRLIVGLAHAVVVPEIYADSERALDVVKFCNQIGKLLFVVIDPEIGALADESSLTYATQNGAVTIEGMDEVEMIIGALV